MDDMFRYIIVDVYKHDIIHTLSSVCKKCNCIFNYSVISQASPYMCFSCIKNNIDNLKS